MKVQHTTQSYPTQIQQQLLMQNQALTQLLQQSGPSSVSSATPMPSMMAPAAAAGSNSMLYPQHQDFSRPGSSSPAKAAHGGGDAVVEAMRRQDNQGRVSLPNDNFVMDFHVTNNNHNESFCEFSNLIETIPNLAFDDGRAVPRIRSEEGVRSP